MNGQKLAGILGLALRARQAALGTDASRIMIRTGKCGLLLLDGDAGLNTRKKAEESAFSAKKLLAFRFCLCYSVSCCFWK